MNPLWTLLGNPEDKGEQKPSPLWNLLGTGETIDQAARPLGRPVEAPPCTVEFNREMIFWAMRNLPFTEATKHFLICGATGSGKSVTIQLFLQSIKKRFAPTFVTPSILTGTDIKSLPALAEKLLEKSDDVSSFLAGQLEPATMGLLTSYSPSNPNLRQLRAALVRDLNRIVAGASIYDSRRFQKVILRLQTTELMGKNPDNERDLVQLNCLLLEDAYPADLARQGPEQLIIFDAKNDAIPMLSAMGLGMDQPNVWLINPYDSRSAEWNLSEITSTDTMARHVATLLIPEERAASGGSRYYTDASRELVLACILGLSKNAGSLWTLRDLLCALTNRDIIRAVTAQHERASQLAARILDDHMHSAAVLSSVGSKLGHYEQIAALWHNQKDKRIFSIAEFLKKPGVLILGNDPVLRESLWPINAILLKSLTSEILRGEDTLLPRHWFVLDEFRAMERLDCMPDLLNRGRSKGASVLIGLQGIEGLEDHQVYGKAQTHEMLGQCGYKTFLRVGGPATAEWAQRLFGEVRYQEPSRSESWDAKGDYSHSLSYRVTDRTAYLASTFMNLPNPVVDGIYESINDVPYLQTTLRVKRPFNLVLQWRDKKDPNIKEVEPRDKKSDQTFHAWKRMDEELFCGKRIPASGAKSKSKGKSKSKSTTKKGRSRNLPERDQPPD